MPVGVLPLIASSFFMTLVFQRLDDDALLESGSVRQLPAGVGQPSPDGDVAQIVHPDGGRVQRGRVVGVDVRRGFRRDSRPSFSSNMDELIGLEDAVIATAAVGRAGGGRAVQELSDLRF